MSESKDVGGAPTKYKEEYNEQARKLCLLGYTDEQLADFFGVCKATINNWKHDHDGFLDSLKKGKAIADAEVAASLYKRALGYETKEMRISGGGDDDSSPAAIETTKEVPPDTTAAIFWLKNRQPESWRDKQEIDHGVSDGMAERILRARRRANADSQKSG